MSLNKCIDNALKNKEITRDEARDLKDRVKLFENSKQKGKSTKDRLAEELAAKSKRRERSALWNEKIRQNVERDVMGHISVEGKNDPAQAAKWLVSNEGQAKFQDVQYTAESIEAMIGAKLKKAINQGYRKHKVLGDLGRQQDSAKQMWHEIGREVFEEGTDNPLAAEIGREIRDALETLRQMRNAAGGNIGHLKKRGLPQIHDTVKLVNVGARKWVEDVTPLLRGADGADGKGQGLMDFEAQKQYNEALEETYNTIVSNDLINKSADEIKPGMRKSLGEKGSEHRELHFKDFDSWIKYQEMYGEGDIFAAVMQSVTLLSRDIALSQRLGTNPTAMLEYASNLAKHAAHNHKFDNPVKKTNTENAAYADVSGKNAMLMLKRYRGDFNVPVNEKMADGFATARNVVTSSTLGGAMLSALTDTTFGAYARAFAGMPANTAIKQGLTNTVGMLAPGGHKRAERAYTVIDGAKHRAVRESRTFTANENLGRGNYMTDRVLTWSGMSPWTQGSKDAWSYDFLEFATSNLDRNFDDLPGNLQHMFEASGMGANDWKALGNYKTGDALLSVEDMVEGGDQSLALKLLSTQRRFARLATPEPNLAAQVFMYGDSLPGTWQGEFWRTLWQFKSFGVGLVFSYGTHVYRQSYRHGAGSAAGHAIALVMGLTAMGAVVVQLKEMAKGRDPRNMNDEAFWGAAFMQGGGAGIYGDFLFGDLNRFGGGVEGTLVGPMVGKLINPLRNLTVGNSAQTVGGKDTNVASEAFRFGKSIMPGLPFVPNSTLWYSRLAWDRMFWDQVQKEVDPKAHQYHRRDIRRRQREHKQEYFWAPGQEEAARGPDLGAAWVD